MTVIFQISHGALLQLSFNPTGFRVQRLTPPPACKPPRPPFNSCLVDKIPSTINERHHSPRTVISGEIHRTGSHINNVKGQFQWCNYDMYREMRLLWTWSSFKTIQLGCTPNQCLKVFTANLYLGVLWVKIS